MLNTSSTDLFQVEAPDGRIIDIPRTVDCENDIYKTLTTPQLQKAYYDQHGYLVARNLIPSDYCDQVLQAFQKEVQRFPGYIYRQTSSLPEQHQLTEQGYILNSIKHIQDMDPRIFSTFIPSTFQAVAHQQVSEMVHVLIDDESVIVQTMFFDGNPKTPPHYDAYYLDSSDSGRMVGIWVALEDIHPGAGRFFVYPGSHLLDLPDNQGPYEITEHHPQFLDAIKKIITDQNLECRAPALKKGDVLFWNSLTIHGSLKTSQPEFSRKSLTAHFIPASQGYVLFQKTKMTLNVKQICNFPVHCPKDPNRFLNRIQMLGLRVFPGFTQNIRKGIIRLRMK